MKIITWPCIYLLICCIAESKNVKMFQRNTNYWNKDNWREHQVPCSENHIIFPTRAPKVFLNGISKQYYVSEMVLPENGVLILDDMITLTSANFANEVHECDSTVSYYNKLAPDHWYDPSNWCESQSMKTSCLMKPRIEASIVPSANDFVVFPPQNTFLVGINPTEPRILANRIFFRDKVYSNSNLFRQRIRRSFSNSIVEFLNINSSSPPQIDLQGDKCKKNICNKNSNLEKMATICKYVSCKSVACAQWVRPKGSCCDLCGHILEMRLLNSSNKDRFVDWFDNLVKDMYQTKMIFDLLSTNKDEFQLTLSSLSDNQDDFDDLVQDVMKQIDSKKKLQGVDFLECISCKRSISKSGLSRITIAVLLSVLLVSITILTMAVLIKLYRPNWFSGTSIKLPSMPHFRTPRINFNFFTNNFSRTRLKEQVDDVSLGSCAFSTVFPDGVEAIELPDTSNEISFDNPMYSSEKMDDTKQ